MNLRKNHYRYLSKTKRPANQKSPLSVNRFLSRFLTRRIRGFAYRHDRKLLSRSYRTRCFRISQNPNTKNIKKHTNKQLTFTSPKTKYKQILYYKLKSKTTLNNKYLNSHINKKHNKIQYLI